MNIRQELESALKAPLLEFLPESAADVWGEFEPTVLIDELEFSEGSNDTKELKSLFRFKGWATLYIFHNFKKPLDFTEFFAVALGGVTVRPDPLSENKKIFLDWKFQKSTEAINEIGLVTMLKGKLSGVVYE